MHDFLYALQTIRKNKPLIHHITNLVTMQDCANICTAIGASPIMAMHKAEVEVIAKGSDALVLNAGTPSPGRFQAMEKAGCAANEKGVPIVFDPVGLGASSFRTSGSQALLKMVKPAIIKGNAAEIAFLAGQGQIVGRGVDGGGKIDELGAKKLAKNRNTIVAVTGRVDFITDGTRQCHIDRGTSLLASISGSGCMTTTLIACFAAVLKDYFSAACMGVLAMNIAGEIALLSLLEREGPGMFKVRLFDSIFGLLDGGLELKKGIHFR